MERRPIWKFFAPLSMVALHNTPWHRESDNKRFLGKKTANGACALLCQADFIFAYRAKFLISITRSDPLSYHDRIRDAIRDPIRSGLDFVDAGIH